MSLPLRTLTLLLAGLAAPLGAFAQAEQAPPVTSPSQTSASGAAPSKGVPSSAQSEAGEPRANTSEAAPEAAAQPAQPAQAPAQPAQAPAQSAQAPAPRPASGRSAGGSASGSHAPTGTAAGGKPTATDRLELGTATVTGDREQPKVMYIVPWKKSDIGDLSGKPMNSLLDEALAPVDRDEFKRQVMYYQVVKADASQNGAAKPPAAQGEK
jgi:hypothetical protein